MFSSNTLQIIWKKTYNLIIILRYLAIIFLKKKYKTLISGLIENVYALKRLYKVFSSNSVIGGEAWGQQEGVQYIKGSNKYRGEVYANRGYKYILEDK
jgi:hypothetical protein